MKKMKIKKMETVEAHCQWCHIAMSRPSLWYHTYSNMNILERHAYENILDQKGHMLLQYLIDLLIKESKKTFLNCLNLRQIVGTLESTGQWFISWFVSVNELKGLIEAAVIKDREEVKGDFFEEGVPGGGWTNKTSSVKVLKYLWQIK